MTLQTIRQQQHSHHHHHYRRRVMRPFLGGIPARVDEIQSTKKVGSSGKNEQHVA